MSRKNIKMVSDVAVAELLATGKLLLIIPILISHLGTEGYGRFILAYTILLTIPTIFSLGLPFAQVRFLAEEDCTRDRHIYFTSLSVALISTSLFSIGAYSILSFLELKPSYLFIEMIALALLMTAKKANLDYFRGNQLMGIHSKFKILDSVLFIVVVLASSYLSGEFQTVVLSLGVSDLTILIISLREIFRRTPLPSNLINLNLIKEMLYFSIPSVPQNLSSWLVQSSDRYIIEYVSGPRLVGVYNPAYSLASVTQLLVAPIRIILPSYLPGMESQSVDGTLDDIIDVYYYIMLPAIFGITITSDYLLSIIANQEVVRGGSPVVPVLAIAMFFSGLFAIYFQILNIDKTVHLSGILWIGGAVVNILMNFYLIPTMGILGAAISTLVSYAIVTGVMYSLVSERIALKIPTFIKYFVNSSLMYISLSIIESHLDPMLLIPTGVVIYLSGSYVTGFYPQLMNNKSLHRELARVL